MRRVFRMRGNYIRGLPKPATVVCCVTSHAAASEVRCVRKNKMATARPKPKSATEILIEKYAAIVEDAARRMTPEEFAAAERDVDNIIARARVRASRERKPQNVD
jgi:hypothetical protein